jgi:hypothetical protein
MNEHDDIPAWVRVLVAVALLALLASLAGCGDSPHPGEANRNGTRVDDHVLEDGTRCAVLSDRLGHPVAMACDWQHEPQVRLPTAAQVEVTADGELKWIQR